MRNKFISGIFFAFLGMGSALLVGCKGPYERKVDKALKKSEKSAETTERHMQELKGTEVPHAEGQGGDMSERGPS